MIINKRYTKIILTCYICFIITTSSFLFVSAKNNSNNDSSCYGFIIPLPQGLDTTNETFENSRVRHMINDLLRENISVYWPKDDFSALSKTFHQENLCAEMVFYKKGAFVVPFSGDEFKDALTTSIIHDYNQTHELEKNCLIKNEAYILQEKLNIKTDKLAEPKIVQHLGKATRYSWPTYLLQADDGGFLTFEYLLNDETSEQLNNEDFNLFIWPYLPEHATQFEQFETFTNNLQVNAIRSFVRNGGGFIGTCYGAQAASSGIIFLSTPFALRYAYNPDLSKILPSLCLSLSDSKMWINLEAVSKRRVSYHKVENTNHPVFYGVNHTIKDFFGGPVFVWLGKNTHVLATFQDLRDRDDGPNVNKNAKKFVVGKPSWVNSTFGKGKIVLYSSHPDYINNIYPLFQYDDYIWDGDEFYGRRIIHNSMFYVTSEENVGIETSISYPLSFINSIIEKTENLSFDEPSNHEFETLSQRLTGFSNDISIFKNMTMWLRNLFAPLENKSNFFEKGERFLRYVYWYCDLYNDYINRTLSSLNMLEQVIPLLVEFDESIIEHVADLKNDINQRLNHSEELLSKVTKIAEKLEEIITSSRLSILKKLQLLKDRKTLLEMYIIELKYIPQTYFESLKLVRHSWYNYEANIAITV